MWEGDWDCSLGREEGVGFQLRSDCGILFTCLTGQTTVTVTIRAYNAMGEVNIMTNNQILVVAFPLGTRILLTCDVTGLPEDSEVLSYKWYHNCAYERCEIREGDPYYRVVADTLLVDVTSENNVGIYNCHVAYRSMQGETVTAKTFTPRITLAGQCTCHKHDNVHSDTLHELQVPQLTSFTPQTPYSPSTPSSLMYNK